MDLNDMRKDITEVIDDIKYHSDSLTDLDRLPVIQLKVLLAKINKLTEKTTILLHYVESKSQISSRLRSYKETTDSSERKEQEHKKEIVVEKKVEESAPMNTEHEDIGKEVRENAVSDLMSAIGINEKYLFASELFGGSVKEFKSSIATFNKIIALQEANDFLEKLSQQFNWDEEKEITIEFYQLIQRRYESV